jgi:hypothetical protein
VSADPTAAPDAEPTEEELRRAYEAELSRITTTDMMAQAVVSLLNLGARRLGLSPGSEADATEQDAQGPAGAAAERDLEQVRDAIDGVRALMGILERTIAQELGPLRDALSQLQMAYAREVRSGAPASPSGAGEGGAGQGSSGPGGEPGGPSGGAGAPGREDPPGAGQTPQPGRNPGPAESSGRLWVPGS